MSSSDPHVGVAWLRAHLGDRDLVVVDCRWVLGSPGEGARLYAAGHVPGASFLDVDADLAAPAGDAAHGRHPLPAADAFEQAARRAGISASSFVVACDATGTEGGAARLWWLLRHFGHSRVALLDGGVEEWSAQGGPLERGDPPERDGDFRAHPREDDVADLAEVRDRVLADDPSLVLIDARAPGRYAGAHEPIDPVAGHIPGARNIPFATVRDDDLGDRLTAAGVVPGADVVAYCGSGISATVVIAAAVRAGADSVRLYPGSWSEWCRQGLRAETEQ